jgi:hypothetical protein
VDLDRDRRAPNSASPGISRRTAADPGIEPHRAARVRRSRPGQNGVTPDLDIVKP